MDIKNAKAAKEILKIGALYQQTGNPSRLIYRGFRAGTVDNMIKNQDGTIDYLDASVVNQSFGTYIFVTESGIVVEFESLELIEPWK